MLVAILAFGMLIVPRLVRAIASRGWIEPLTVFAVGLAFVLAVLAEHLGYSVALGAFVAGVLVAESGHGTAVEHRVAPLRDVFAAIFFVSIGMTADPSLLVEAWPTALTIAVVVIAGQFLSVMGASLVSGVSLTVAVPAALSLGQIGEFSFIIAEIGASAAVRESSDALGRRFVASANRLTPWGEDGRLGEKTLCRERRPWGGRLVKAAPTRRRTAQAPHQAICAQSRARDNRPPDSPQGSAPSAARTAGAPAARSRSASAPACA